MKRASWRLAALLAAVLCNSGCWVYSLYPLAGPADNVKERQLAGTWAREGSAEPETLTIALADKGYDLVYFDKDQKTSHLKASLVQLGPNRFFSITADDASLDPIPTPVIAHLVPAYSVWKLWLQGDTLRMSPLSDDWLKQQLKKKMMTLPYKEFEDEMVLLAPSPELQKFVQRNADAAFPEDKAWIFKRK